MNQESELEKELKEKLKESLPILVENIKEDRKSFQTALKSLEEGLKDEKTISKEEWRNATPEQIRIEFMYIMKFIFHIWDKTLENEQMILLHSAFVFNIYEDTPSESENSQILTMRKELEELKEFHKYVLEAVANKPASKTIPFEGMYE